MVGYRCTDQILRNFWEAVDTFNPPSLRNLSSLWSILCISHIDHIYSRLFCTPIRHFFNSFCVFLRSKVVVFLVLFINYGVLMFHAGVFGFDVDKSIKPCDQVVGTLKLKPSTIKTKTSAWIRIFADEGSNSSSGLTDIIIRFFRQLFPVADHITTLAWFIVDTTKFERILTTKHFLNEVHLAKHVKFN